MPELNIQNIRKQYNKNIVVKDISLSVKSGEVIGLLGPNGAGKTTSFYMIVGLVSADHGSISIDNKPISPFNPASDIKVFMLSVLTNAFLKIGFDFFI